MVPTRRRAGASRRHRTFEATARFIVARASQSASIAQINQRKLATELRAFMHCPRKRAARCAKARLRLQRQTTFDPDLLFCCRSQCCVRKVVVVSLTSPSSLLIMSITCGRVTPCCPRAHPQPTHLADHCGLVEGGRRLACATRAAAAGATRHDRRTYLSREVRTALGHIASRKMAVWLYIQNVKWFFTKSRPLMRRSTGYVNCGLV
jgi:hypothetical protein